MTKCTMLSLIYSHPPPPHNPQKGKKKITLVGPYLKVVSYSNFSKLATYVIGFTFKQV